MGRAAQRRRRRRRRRLFALAAVTVGATAGGVALVRGDGGSPRVEIAVGAVAGNTSNGLTVELPDGWQRLPLVDRDDPPPEVLVVGTAARPAKEPIDACAGGANEPPGPSAYLTLVTMSGVPLICGMSLSHAVRPGFHGTSKRRRPGEGLPRFPYPVLTGMSPLYPSGTISTIEGAGSAYRVSVTPSNGQRGSSV